MDDLDRKILALLAKNARMPVKEIAEQVALTSPAVSSRIHKLRPMASSAAIPSHSTARQTACMWMPSSAFRWPPPSTRRSCT